MLRPFVQETGRLLDYDGVPVVLGVDYSCVTITVGRFTARLDAAEQVEFAQQFADAIQVAAAQADQLEE